MLPSNRKTTIKPLLPKQVPKTHRSTNVWDRLWVPSFCVKEPCPRSTLCWGTLSLKCVKLWHNPKFYGIRTAQCKVGKAGNVVERKHGEWGRARLEYWASACESSNTHSKAGSSGKVRTLTHQSQHCWPLLFYHCISWDRVLLWPPCLTAHKRKRFWDLILSPCCVFWGNSFLLETRSPNSVP